MAGVGVWEPKVATAGSKATRRIRHVAGNFTSRSAREPATGKRVGGHNNKDYTNISSTPDEVQFSNRAHSRLLGGALGFTAGALGGGAVGSHVGSKKYPDAKKLYKEPVKKRAIRITSLGTSAERAENFAARHPVIDHLPGKKTAAVGLVGGVGLGYQGSVANRKSEQAIYRKKKAAMAKNDVFGKKLNATKDERKRALWYNDDFSPKKSPYSKPERKVAAKIMGKEQLKGQGKGFAVGGTLGAAAGAAVGSHFGAKAPGAVVGGITAGAAGQLRGDYTGRVKGRRKYKEILGKSSSLSAFGVDHG